jgi:hypothetical protein
MVKRVSMYFIFMMISCLSFFSSAENFPAGARAAGMSNASVTLSDIWSVNNNQAGLSGIKDLSAAICYENRFGLKTLGDKAGVLIIPTSSGVFGLSLNNFGYSRYSENQLGLAYARTFGNKFSAGLSLDYFSVHIAEDYGRSSAIAGEIGMIYKITGKLKIGAHLYNPTRSKLSDQDNEYLPTALKLGLSYEFSKKIIVAIESEKDIQYDGAFKAGFEYHPVKQLYFRAGISTEPVLNSFGFGLEYANLHLDFAATYHRVLGFTPQISLLFHVAGKNKAVKAE